MKNKGQTLIELLTTITIAAIFIVALVSISTGALGGLNSSRTQNDANHYAKEGMEWLRGQRDASWDTFYAKASGDGSTWCISALSWSGGACGATVSGTSFKREAVITSASSTKVSITVNVTWTDGAGPHRVQINSELNKWQ